MTDLYIIGAGMGSPALLTEEAVSAAKQCKRLYAFDRIGAQMHSLNANLVSVSYGELLSALREPQESPVGVLVSGDVGFFSIAATLEKAFSTSYSISHFCGISCLQYLCAKCRVPTADVAVVSLHGREGALLGSISYNPYTFVLTGGSHNAGTILKDLARQGLGQLSVTAGERLSMETECIRKGTVAALSVLDYDSLTVLLFENPAPANRNAVLFDSQMHRGGAPMTKQEIRWTSLAYLDVQPADIVYDIGAGTGSVSIELGRKAYRGMVYAIEQKEEAYGLLCENRERSGAYNVLPIFGKAAEQLPELPVPDRVFMGGTGRELPRLVSALLQVNPRVRIVLNAVTLETLGEAMAVFKEHSLRIETACINASHSKALGSYTMMAAQNPVYIIRASAEACEE